MNYAEKVIDFDKFVKDICPKYFIKVNEEYRENYFQNDFILHTLYDECNELRGDNF